MLPWARTLVRVSGMRFWWVNQNQTYLHEIAGGYVWSPKRKANGVINPFYESMREVIREATSGQLILNVSGVRAMATGMAPCSLTIGA